jgi:hypothetical protein
VAAVPACLPSGNPCWSTFKQGVTSEGPDRGRAGRRLGAAVGRGWLRATQPVSDIDWVRAVLVGLAAWVAAMSVDLWEFVLIGYEVPEIAGKKLAYSVLASDVRSAVGQRRSW